MNAPDTRPTAAAGDSATLETGPDHQLGQLAELREAVRNAPSMPLVLEPIPGISWMAIDPANPATLPKKGYWLVTVDADDGSEVHVLWHSGDNKWLHDGEYTFQHGYHFRPVAWAPRPEAYAGEVLE